MAGQGSALRIQRLGCHTAALAIVATEVEGHADGVQPQGALTQTVAIAVCPMQVHRLIACAAHGGGDASQLPTLGRLAGDQRVALPATGMGPIPLIRWALGAVTKQPPLLC